MGKRWRDESHEVINVNNHPAAQSHNTTDAWFTTENSTWDKYRFSGSAGITYSSNNRGFNAHDVDTIAWYPQVSTDSSRHIGVNDNIYLWNPEHDVGGVITNTRPYGINYTERKDMTDYGLPMNFIDSYHVKKNDKPTVGANDYSYNVDVKYDKHLADGYYGFKISDYKNYTNVVLSDNSKGDPCPGTSRKGFVEPNKIRCVYNKTELNALANNPGARGTASPVKEAMYTKILSDFCHKDGNEEVVIAGKKCVEHAQFENVAQRYCEKGSNIKDKSACSKTKYPKYHESAVKYCDANPSNDWCRCYTAQAKCRTNMNHAGCTEYKRIYDSYESVKGQPGYDQVVANIPCSVGCGGGAVYTPKDQTPCPENITVCGMTVEASQLRDSQVNIEQKCSSGSGDASSSPSSGDSPSSTGDSPSSKGDSPPPKDKTKMYIGIGVGVVVFIILLLVLLGGDGENYNNNYNNF